jgi:hypothetical protein
MKRIFSLLSAVVLFGGVALVTSCNDKESQSGPKITLEFPLLVSERDITMLRIVSPLSISLKTLIKFAV